MRRFGLVVSTMVVVASGVVSAQPTAPVEPPTLATWEFVDVEGDQGWLLFGDEAVGGDQDWALGLAAVCSRTQGVSLVGYFGPFPPDGRPVQFAARRPDRTVERAGPVIRNRSGSELHTSVVRGRDEVLRLASALLETGALVSNGYYSFWNGAESGDNARVLAHLEGCRVRR